MKVTIVKIASTNKKKDGTELKDKWGNPQVRVGIQTTLHGDRWISGFLKPGQVNWKEGDEVEIDLKESEQVDTNGRPYLNFYLPRPEYVTKQEFSALEARVKKLEGPAGEEINVEDIPF